MVELRTYLDLHGQYLPDAKYMWAGSNFNRLLFKSDETFSDNTPVSDLTWDPGTSSTDCISTFLLPSAIDYQTVVDGTVFGTINSRIFVNNSGEDIWLTGAYVDLLKIDSSGSETSLFGGYHEAWSGSKHWQYPSTSYAFCGFPFWKDVDEQHLSNEERLALRVKLTAYDDGSATELRLLLSKNSDDLKLRIPFVL